MSFQIQLPGQVKGVNKMSKYNSEWATNLILANRKSELIDYINILYFATQFVSICWHDIKELTVNSLNRGYSAEIEGIPVLIFSCAGRTRIHLGSNEEYICFQGEDRIDGPCGLFSFNVNSVGQVNKLISTVVDNWDISLFQVNSSLMIG